MTLFYQRHEEDVNAFIFSFRCWYIECCRGPKTFEMMSLVNDSSLPIGKIMTTSSYASHRLKKCVLTIYLCILCTLSVL